MSKAWSNLIETVNFYEILFEVSTLVFFTEFPSNFSSWFSLVSRSLQDVRSNHAVKSATSWMTLRRTHWASRTPTWTIEWVHQSKRFGTVRNVSALPSRFASRKCTSSAASSWPATPITLTKTAKSSRGSCWCSAKRDRRRICVGTVVPWTTAASRRTTMSRVSLRGQ